jgi:hypothetical protein
LGDTDKAALVKSSPKTGSFAFDQMRMKQADIGDMFKKPPRVHVH